MADPAPSARTEELRLTLVMNGGVSLAVWIGGVSNEIARAVRELHPVYRNLLELTSTRARVDVISGSSAGGINGAALALSLRFSTDLSQMRELWREKGSFTSLLRSPSEPDPPSLLDGDGYFLPALEDAFDGLRGDPAKSPGLPMRLVLTATLLHAKPKATMDDLGSVVQDSDHKALFTFTQDHFARPDIARRLAFASRATASFPVAFEPVYCQVEKSDSAKKAPDTADYSEFVNFGNSRFLIDGGVLDNKPFEAALDQIPRLPADNQMRRVLVYVAPDPGSTAKAAPDKPEDRSGLGAVALAAAFGIPAAQTINGQLQRIKEHNNQVRYARQEAVEIMRLLNGQRRSEGADAAFAATFFDLYRRHRLDGAFEYILDLIEQAGADPVNPAGTGQGARGLGRRTRAWLKGVLIAHYSEPDIGPNARWVPSQWPDETFAAGADVQGWSWGLYPVEYFLIILLDFLRRGERLLQDLKTGTVAPALSISAPGTSGFGDPNVVPEEPAPAMAAASLGTWAEAFGLMGEIDAKRRESSGIWKALARNLFDILETAGSDDEQRVIEWLKKGVATTEERNQRLAKTGELALRLAGLFLAIRSEVVKSREQIRLVAGAKGPQSTDAEALLIMIDYFECGNAGEVLDRLLYIEVMQYAMGDRPEGKPAALELVQISGLGKSPFPGTPPLRDKLAGLQLGHFAAFYKKSWRANDWMQGRLDGSERLVRVLLNPERLHRLYGGKTIGDRPASKFVYDQIRQIAVDAVPGEQGRNFLKERWQPQEIERELAFLDRANARVPEMLDGCCGAVTRRLHLGIMDEEIPVVAESVQSDQAEGADEFGPGEELSREYYLGALDPAKLLRLWSGNSLGKEKIAGEFGSDLMTRTLSQTVAITQSAAGSSSAQLGPVRLLLASLSLPVKMFYLFTDQLLRNSRTAAVVNVVLTVVGLLLIACSLIVKDFPQTLGAFGWATTAAGIIAVIVRTPRASFLAAVALFLLAMLVPGLKGAAMVITVAIVLVALIRVPELWGVAAVLVAAWLSVGTPGQAVAERDACGVDFIRSRIPAFCAKVAVPANGAADQFRVVAWSAIAIIGAWGIAVLASFLVRLDRAIRRKWAKLRKQLK